MEEHNMVGGVVCGGNTSLTYFADMATQPNSDHTKQQSPFSLWMQSYPKVKCCFHLEPKRAFLEAPNQRCPWGLHIHCGRVWNRPPDPEHAQPRVNSPGRTFIDSGDVAGKHIIEAFRDKGDNVSLRLSWGFNYMIKLQLLPLETNCMLRLIVFYESHTESEILLSWSCFDLIVMSCHPSYPF